MNSETWNTGKLTPEEQKKLAEEWKEVKARWPDDDCSSEARFLIEAEKVAQIINRANNANSTPSSNNSSPS